MTKAEAEEAIDACFNLLNDLVSTTDPEGLVDEYPAAKAKMVAIILGASESGECGGSVG